jgi:cobalamin biosynthesis protein CobD/CbiB
MGVGRAEANAADIRRALDLYRRALVIQALALFALTGFVIARG